MDIIKNISILKYLKEKFYINTKNEKKVIKRKSNLRNKAKDIQLPIQF